MRQSLQDITNLINLSNLKVHIQLVCERTSRKRINFDLQQLFVHLY